jgi:hypothetical protein
VVAAKILSPDPVAFEQILRLVSMLDPILQNRIKRRLGNTPKDVENFQVHFQTKK